MSRLQEHSIARHEVGHALVAASCGKAVDRCWIAEDGGWTRYTQPVDALSELAVAVAGHVTGAMSECDGQEPLGVRVPWGGQDMRAALAAADELTNGGDDAGPDALNRAVLQAVAALDAAWDAFDGAATALAVRGALSGDEIGTLQGAGALDLCDLAAVFRLADEGFDVCVVVLEALRAMALDDAVVTFGCALECACKVCKSSTPQRTTRYNCE